MQWRLDVVQILVTPWVFQVLMKGCLLPPTLSSKIQPLLDRDGDVSELAIKTVLCARKCLN